MVLLKIKQQEVSYENAELVSVFGQGCDYETKKGVIGYQVDFEISVSNNLNIESEFLIIFQSQDRADNIKAYNGYEMDLGSYYGCDDDFCKLESWLSETEEYELCVNIIAELRTIASDCCKNWLVENSN